MLENESNQNDTHVSQKYYFSLLERPTNVLVLTFHLKRKM